MKVYLDTDGYYVFDLEGAERIKVLQLTDIHLGATSLVRRRDEMAKKTVRTVVADAAPDLVVCTGDNVYPVPVSSFTINNKRQTATFVELMESLGVYWTTVFGNHDTESYATGSKKDLAEIYHSGAHCLFSEGPEDIFGLGNTMIKIKDGDRLISVLVMLDSNMYTQSQFFSGFDCIHDDQVEWYSREITRLCLGGDSIIPSFAFFHIPVQAYRDAWFALKRGDPEAKYYFGDVGEGTRRYKDYFGCPKKDGRFWDEVLALGSTKGLFCGHDHLNTSSIEYKGVRLTYGYSVDYLAYLYILKRSSQRGGTLLTIDRNANFDIKPIFYVNK